MRLGEHDSAAEVSPRRISPSVILPGMPSGKILGGNETRTVDPAEFARIKKLGAKVIKEPYEMEKMWIATFADPDGNYFQLMSPWK